MPSGGRAVYACLILAIECDGADIVTIEGLGGEDALDSVQQAFIEKDAMQCGFCTPGQILSIKGLQNRLAGESPNEEQLKHDLAGNLCRCGAYPNILRAARAALTVVEDREGEE
jgi:xanthine dehydrogenase YagT iron-sulfur-binding subunit